MLPHMMFAVMQQEHKERIMQNNIERVRLRDNSDPFSALTEEQFQAEYRLSKNMLQFIIAELEPHMEVGQTYNSISPTLRILAAIYFYAGGSYQRVAGKSYHLAMSQTSISRCVEEVSMIIFNRLGHLIRFPETAAARYAIKQVFMEKCNFPGVIGAIDGTHVPILATVEEEHNYVNRKGYHSKNIQIICDYNLKILNINANFPGACHDSYIWRNSVIQTHLRRLHEDGDQNSWLLGDSGYPQQPWLMTPILNAQAGTPQETYNQRHASARNCVERCIGVLKSRFRCISSDNKLRYTPEKVAYITSACAILNNMCMDGNLGNVDVVQDQEEMFNNVHYRNNDVNAGAGNERRNTLINAYFR